MKRLLAALAVSLLGFAAPLAAQNNPVVVELFTSQGCSSCPPADAMLHELAKRDDVIALALHVDYWDYIGWKDPFGDPAHAARQRAYASVANRRTIYTPEMIVDGQTDVVGAKSMRLAEAILDHAHDTPKVDLTLARQGDQVVISAKPLVQITGPFDVRVLRYVPEQTTEIKRGENRGKTLSYANVVRDMKVVSKWDGKTSLSLTTQMAGNDPLVVIIQSADPGPILAAAQIK